MQSLTIHDVARKAGVAKSTVSRVLQGQNHVSENARARVNAAMQTLGYQPNKIAGGLRSKRTHTIGLVIPDISNPFFPEVTLGVQEVAEARGYALLLANSGWSQIREEGLLGMCQRNRLDGLIINPVSISNAALHAFGRPVVVLGTRSAYKDFDNIGTDTRETMRIALQHLHALGHRHIVCLPGPEGADGVRKRIEALRHAQKRIKAAPSLAWLHCDYSQSDAMAVSAKLRDDFPTATAALCGNDLIAIGLISGLRKLHVGVPDQFSVIGIDDIELAAAGCPALTTIHKPKRELGQLAATLLLDRLEGKTDAPPQIRHLATTLVLRDSTAPINQPCPEPGLTRRGFENQEEKAHVKTKFINAPAPV